jgi:phenylpropionate dioxygenase-like ring-hydroxylating dioxygenase large terminal subunit
MIENFRGYHCPIQHPGFSTVVDVDEDSYLCSRTPGSESGPRRAALEGRGRKPAYDVGAVTQAQYHYLWPNCTLSINPAIRTCRSTWGAGGA